MPAIIAWGVFSPSEEWKKHELTLSPTYGLKRMSHADLQLNIAVTGIVIAAAMNSLVKAGMATFIGGRKTGIRVGLPLTASAIAGILSVWLWVW